MMPRRVWLIVTLSFGIVSVPLAGGAGDQPGHTTVFAIQDFTNRVAKAEKEGYRVTVQDEPWDFLMWAKGSPTKIVKVTFVKEGKIQEGKGLLGVKWDQRETWHIMFTREGDKLKLFTSERVREVKAPIAGTWLQTERKLAVLPAPLQ